MDIVEALGLSNEIVTSHTDCGTPLSAATLAAIKPTHVTRSIAQAPSAAAVVEKFIRLEKYCGELLRLNITDTQKTRLLSDQSFSGEYNFGRRESDLPAAIRAQMIALLLSLSGHSNMEFTMNRKGDILSFDIHWKHCPDDSNVSMSRSADLRDHLHALISSDPARGWRIGQAASLIGLTTRSLQRYLLAAGCSFTEILRDVRISKARVLLKDHSYTLAEIGYCCGYADQAHFQRDFRNVLQITPRKYRLT